MYSIAHSLQQQSVTGTSSVNLFQIQNKQISSSRFTAIFTATAAMQFSALARHLSLHPAASDQTGSDRGRVA
jgi:hypothetical protein